MDTRKKYKLAGKLFAYGCYLAMCCIPHISLWVILPILIIELVLIDFINEGVK